VHIWLNFRKKKSLFSQILGDAFAPIGLWLASPQRVRGTNTMMEY